MNVHITTFVVATLLSFAIFTNGLSSVSEPCHLDDLKSDPTNCSQFYICTGNAWEILPCFTGLVFNNKTNQCDYPDNVPGCNKKLHQAESSGCDGLPVGSLKPDPEDCSKFYQCTNAGFVQQICTPGLHFNPSTSQCDYPDNVHCIPSTTEPSKVGYPPCGDLPFNELEADPTNCSNFFQCTLSGLVKLTCPPGLYFNPTASVCDYAQNVPCSPITTEAPEQAEPEEESCGGLPLNHLKPDPNNCEQFIQCAPAGLVSLPCPPGLYFNPSTLQCDYPTNVLCYTEDPCQSEQDFNKLYPDPLDCNHFLICSPLGLISQPCAANLRFNPETLLCDYPDNVKCDVPSNSR